MNAGPVRALLRSPALPFAGPFAVLMLAVAAEPLVAAALTVDPRVLYPVRVGSAAVVLAWVLGRSVRVTHPRPGAGAWVAGGVVGAAVFAVWVGLDVPWARLGDGGAYEPRGGFSPALGNALIVFRLAGAVLVAPLAEELFFRGYLMRALVRGDFLAVSARTVPWWAVCAQAGVFALAHTEVLAGLLAGLAYGALYRGTGRLGVVIAAHALTNALLGAWVITRGAWHLW